MGNVAGITTALNGAVVSFGNNRLAGNTLDGSFTATIPQN